MKKKIIEKEFVWEIDGMGSSVWATSYTKARKKILEMLSIQETERTQEV